MKLEACHRDRHQGTAAHRNNCEVVRRIDDNWNGRMMLLGACRKEEVITPCLGQVEQRFGT